MIVANFFKMMELNFTVIERGSEIGGTWYWNSYPGIGCDVPSHLYSFSFYLKPNWTHLFSYGAEIHKYMMSCFYHFGLGDNIGRGQFIFRVCSINKTSCWCLIPKKEFGTEITRAFWNDKTRLWEITKLKDGKTTEESYNVLISCAGGLHRPNWGGFKGVEKYKGLKVHTTRWPQDLDLTGKHVGIIGSGASSIQIIPTIVRDFQIKKLVHFQRNAAFVLPRYQFAYSDRAKSILSIFPFGILYRWSQYLIREIGFFVLLRFWKLGVNKLVQKLHAAGIRKYVKDKRVAEAMVPDYTMGCKRVLISDEFYSALNTPCYHLDNSGIVELSEKGIITKDAEHELDVIIFATGFDMSSNFNFLVEHNPHLEMLRHDAEKKTFWGIFYPKVPNLVALLGPMTALGHSSIIFMIECQLQAIINVIKMLFEERKDCFVVTDKAVNEWNEEWIERIENSIWARSTCVSWYQKGDPNNRAWVLWPGSTIEYWWRTRNIPKKNFDFFN
ncbi:Oidioi.mRNA.OKI2018_I69.chr2.g7977.t1.cds [Oikopleura dioica]|uniref:Flavin-containing monooxygenase n=1 Tax=Oikopleura dioica TaxID=34765 RepID=A0ABN7TEG3_OIKDI|nr:Oidioi.mRNA.OKI2018_I69.chr2.g7977.t1.cds [Oikopleura dioica]